MSGQIDLKGIFTHRVGVQIDLNGVFAHLTGVFVRLNGFFNHHHGDSGSIMPNFFAHLNPVQNIVGATACSKSDNKSVNTILPVTGIGIPCF